MIVYPARFGGGRADTLPKCSKILISPNSQRLKTLMETSDEVSVQWGWEGKSSIFVLNGGHRGYLEEHIDTS